MASPRSLARGHPGPGPGLSSRARAFTRADPLAGVAVLLLIGLIAVAFAAPLISPHGPFELAGRSFEAPNAAFPLGTDRVGRDVLTRVIWGARLSLFVGVVAVGLGVGIGGMWGMASGYWGGRLDLFTQRVIDVLAAFPAIVLALALVAILGQSVTNVVIALAVIFLPSTARTMRGVALGVRHTEYVTAAVAIGSDHRAILWKHVVPNCVPAWLVLATSDIAVAITAEASLSYLGVGVPPDEASWGGMLAAAAQSYISVAPWLALAPGAALTATILSLNFLGDAVRDRLDPRLQHRGAS